MIDTQAWYAANDCQHAHCPLECPKPQPFLAPDGRLLCGRCAAYLGMETVMVPCTPRTCEDEVKS